MLDKPNVKHRKHELYMPKVARTLVDVAPAAAAEARLVGNPEQRIHGTELAWDTLGSFVKLMMRYFDDGELRYIAGIEGAKLDFLDALGHAAVAEGIVGVVVRHGRGC